MKGNVCETYTSVRNKFTLEVDRQYQVSSENNSNLVNKNVHIFEYEISS